MGSGRMVTLIAMRWEKEPDPQEYLRPCHVAMLPFEGLWRVYRRMIGKPSILPAPIVHPRILLGKCFLLLKEREVVRRDMRELFDVMLRIQTHNKMVNAVAQTDSARDAGHIGADDMDRIFTLLWNVQRVTNPHASRPQTKAADKLEEDMEKISDFLANTQGIQIQALD